MVTMAIEDLLTPARHIHKLSELPVNRLAYLLWRDCPDLQRAFDLSTPSGQAALASWWLASTKQSLGDAPPSAISDAMLRAEAVGRRIAGTLPVACKSVIRKLWLRALAARLGHQARSAGRLERNENLDSKENRQQGPFGINLIGHAQEALGLGQCLRFMASALQDAGIPSAIVDFSRSMAVPGLASASLPRGKHANPYAINLFIVSPDVLPFVYRAFGHQFFLRRSNILCAFWELEKWPEKWIEWLSLFDEVWAPSEFVESALRPHLTAGIRTIHPCVVLPPTSPKDRDELGIPCDKFLFLCIADSLSYADRKNPMAVVIAFKKAFSQHRDDVGLICKIANIDRSLPYWRAFERECSSDPRIVLIDRPMKYNEVLALYRATDCFVSLHRAEGFGLCCAEAMLCGRPVIATGYSGNLALTKPDTARLVNYRMVNVLEGQYPHHWGQQWAEPDMDDASKAMHEMAGDAEAALVLGEKGRLHAEAMLTPQRFVRNTQPLFDMHG